MAADVKGQRVIVMGASSGIGRGLACALADRGAKVVGSARRVDRLEELAGVTAVGCDVTSPGEVESLISQSVEILGGLDALVYATGLGRLTPLDRASIQDWLELFSTNLFGAAQLTRAALPHLLAEGSQGRALYLSSDSADTPYPGLVIYGTSKAALSTYTQGLASEFPSLRVSEVLVGPTAGTEVADHFDPELFGELLPKWFEQGFVRYDMLQVEDVASTIIDALEDEAPPSRVMATGTEGTQTVDEVIRMVPEDQRPSDPRLTGMQREQ